MSNERLVEIVEDLEKSLLSCIRTHNITNDEYRAATELITDSVKQGEESLLFDVFFEAEATDIANTERTGSTKAIEGPFYLPAAPWLNKPYVLPQRADEKGDPLLFRGTVRGTNGEPLADAELDMWHADADGLYSNIHPGIPDWNLRGRFTTDTDGTFAVQTILPPPYEIPKFGPTGRLLAALGRHFFRPAHLHLKVTASGYEQLTSQLYFAGGEYLDNDVAGAVRDGLLLHVDTTDTGYLAEYDFTLEPAGEAS